MQIPRLIMHSVQGRIGLTTTPASLKMEQPQADLEIQQPNAEMEISVTPGKLTIDQTQAWEELDRKHIFKRIEEEAQQGHEDVMEDSPHRGRRGRAYEN